MKPREERRKVMVRARMRCGARWADVCILNISTRGLGLQGASPPERGTYVEVRRGRQLVIGRVAWVRGHRFGVRAQDCLAVEAILREPDLSAAAPAAQPPPGRPVERRSAPRARLDRHDRSRLAGRALEYGFVLVFGLSAAAVAFQTVGQALASPLDRVSASLGGSG